MELFSIASIGRLVYKLFMLSIDEDYYRTLSKLSIGARRMYHFIKARTAEGYWTTYIECEREGIVCPSRVMSIVKRAGIVVASRRVNGQKEFKI